MEELEIKLLDFVSYFKKNYRVSDKSEVNKILNSKKYAEFIDMVYGYFNSKLVREEAEQVRLHLECYQDADKTIEQFWSMLSGEKLGNSLNNRVRLGSNP